VHLTDYLDDFFFDPRLPPGARGRPQRSTPCSASLNPSPTALVIKEIKRVPMNKPSGKYNVYNKITHSAGTSH
jgi:hypothetical protein